MNTMSKITHELFDSQMFDELMYCVNDTNITSQ